PPGRGPGDETGRRWPTKAHHRSAPSPRSALREHAGEAVQVLGPAAPVLVGIALLLRIRPGAQLVTAFGHTKTGPLVALGRQRELDEHRVAGHRLLPPGMVPAEREASRRIDRLHDDRAALVPELHVAMSAGFHDQVHPVGEPLTHL